jgi:arabinogalactan endo-1,4-beta-galactosidase
VNLDFHYSDVWADPGSQTVPEAWKEITNIDVLCDSVYNYTYRVMETLKSRNLLPEMVQIGNETNCGMMLKGGNANFPNLSVCNSNWPNFGKVVNAGIRAVRAVDAESGKKTVIALHVADPKNLDWWLNAALNTGKITDFDVMGFSFYHIWHTTVSFEALPALVKSTKAKYGKELMILETAYPFTTANNDSYNNTYGAQAPIAGFAYSSEGQRAFMIALTQNMKNAGLKGIMYWEPAWITSNLKDLWGKGSTWENCTFFDFSGNLTATADYLDYAYTK